jgi:transposase
VVMIVWIRPGTRTRWRWRWRCSTVRSANWRRCKTDNDGYPAMMCLARRWPQRNCAVEGASGVGTHLARRLARRLADGETALDVPPKLATRARIFDPATAERTTLSWAQRSRIPSFVKLAQRIRKHRAVIDASLDHGLSNGLIESTNTKIRLFTRIAFGFKSPEALVALAMLSLGGYRPSLPGRTAHG